MYKCTGPPPPQVSGGAVSVSGFFVKLTSDSSMLPGLRPTGGLPRVILGWRDEYGD